MFIFSSQGHEHSCPVCGFKMSDFIFEHKLGCSFCYVFLPTAIKNLIRSVQDDAVTHIGKRNSTTNSLLRDFFFYALEQEGKENPEELQSCEKIKEILNDYF